MSGILLSLFYVLSHSVLVSLWAYYQLYFLDTAAGSEGLTCPSGDCLQSPCLTTPLSISTNLSEWACAFLVHLRTCIPPILFLCKWKELSGPVFAYVVLFFGTEEEGERSETPIGTEHMQYLEDILGVRNVVCYIKEICDSLFLMYRVNKTPVLNKPCCTMLF